MLCCGGPGLRSCSARPCRGPLAVFFLRLHSKHTHLRGMHLCRAASESPHRILGIAPSASEADIKRAYRKLALRYHPDVNKEPDAQQRFMSIKSAYQTLVDSNGRSVNQSKKVDPFHWGYSTSREEGPNEFYDKGGDIWEDVQNSFVLLWDFAEEFLGDLQAGFNKISAANNPKSLWEELSEIGEEFVEFLEKELNFVDDIKQVIEEDGNNIGFASGKGDKFSRKGTSEQARRLEIEINEIEEMLAKLKQDLGL